MSGQLHKNVQIVGTFAVIYRFS